MCYAKASPEEIHIRIVAANRGPEAAELHLLPTLWFRNTWGWGPVADEWGNLAAPSKPRLALTAAPTGAHWAVRAQHDTLGEYWLYGREALEPLFTDNETNNERLWGQPNASPYVKDAFHRRVVQGETAAVNPAQCGTKFAGWLVASVATGQSATLALTLSRGALDSPFAEHEAVLTQREAEATAYYDALQPGISGEDARILRQALAGMIWTKQFFHYDVARWQDGDQIPPPAGRCYGRNRGWRHMKAADVISMPDKWEYPWFAAWDLAFHCATLALVDVDFAKDQIELLLRENYLHPNGQVPAYEWAFGDVNPPVLAMAALKAFRAERVQRGTGDLNFLERVSHKMLLNYTWWLNRKDADGHNVFEGGFLGLDNISVYDRSHPLPPGYSLKQADSTGWMAMFAINMTVMALELAAANRDYEDVAIQCYEQFMAIAHSIAGYNQTGLSLWDEKDEFFKDLVVAPDGAGRPIDVFSWVGLIPLFAVEVIDQRLLDNVPRFAAVLVSHYKGTIDGHKVTHCPIQTNARNEHLLSLLGPARLRAVLQRVLDERQFLSPFGVRSLSHLHAEQRDLGTLPGIGRALIEYVPGESNSPLFGGNSNWRGPIWMPTNYVLIQAIEKFYRYYGPKFKVVAPFLGDRQIALNEAANLIAERLVNIFRRAPDGRIPAHAEETPFQSDPHWKHLLLFYEYFHGDTGQGLGAMHQTGWTGLVANLVERKYRLDIPAFWREQQAREPASAAHG